MKSVWSDTSEFKSFETLQDNIKTDVLVIGGGIAGILCAYALTEAGVDCVLAEANSLCGGITKNTTAKITSQHGLIYGKLITKFGAEKAKMYLEANQAAIQKYRELCGNIDCDFEDKDAYVYSLTDREKLYSELRAIKKLGGQADFAENLPLPIPTVGAVRFKNQAQFNPLKFLSAIIGNLKIFEHTAVNEVRDVTAYTDGGSIRANKIVVATHFPFMNKHGLYFLKMYQDRSYVLALEGAQDVKGMYIDEATGGLSFRNYKNLLLLGGNSHRTGKDRGGWDMLTDFADEYYPNAEEAYRWATQDCMTLDGVPYIGRYSIGTHELYVTTGFNKWGMTSSMVSAMLLTDMITSRENPYKEMFSPSRTALRPQLAVNAFEATVNLLNPTTRRCPHMGCALKWNRQERTWDCPCHGSRFTHDGKLIDNPATGDINKRKP